MVSKSKRLGEGRMIDKNVLIFTFKRIKRNPLKVFVGSDLFPHYISKMRKYLNVLISLGLIEQVPAIYNFGKPNQKSSRSVKGYRLNKI